MPRKKPTKNIGMSNGQEQVVKDLLSLLLAIYLKTSDPVLDLMLRAMQFGLLDEDQEMVDKYKRAYDQLKQIVYATKKSND